MPKIKFYHLRTMIWTYSVWAVLNLFFAFLLCIPREQLYMHPEQTNNLLLLVPLTWAMLHIAPLWCFILTCWYGEPQLFIGVDIVTVIAFLSIVVGILIKKQWAQFLIIAGMSIWFLVSLLIGGAAL